jgi:xylose dehydrogenase (NAD/NADP)
VGYTSEHCRISCDLRFAILEIIEKETTMTDNHLRWGLISTAVINEALIPAIRACRRSELVAVASRDAQRAAAYADEWSIPASYGGYDDLLAASDVDVVYIPLPNSLHAEWAVRAAEAGKHILCEKPLALTVSDVDSMVDAARRSNVVLFEGFMYRHHPQMLQLQELIRDGAIGDVRVVRATFAFYLDRPGDVRFEADLGGGSLWDVGCYPVSFAQAVMGGAPREVFGWQRMGDTGVDLTFAGQMHYRDGRLALFDCSLETSFRAWAEVVGSEGSLWLDHPWKPSREGPAAIRLIRDEGSQTLDIEEVDPYLCEVQAMENCVLDGDDPILALTASREIAVSLTALYESARTGKPVGISGGV